MNWLTVVLLLCVILFTVMLLYKFASKSTQWWVLVLVFFSWNMDFAVIVLIPYDVEMTLRGLQDNWLETAWKVMYWTLFVMCWFVLPVSQGYLMGGEFTFFGKLGTALYRRIRTILVMSALGLAFIIYLFIRGTLDPQNVPAFLVAMSNCWGLFLIIMLLGYGLVAIPRSAWNNGNIKATLNYYYFKTVGIDQNLSDNKHDLTAAVEKANGYSQTSKQDSSLRKYIDAILSKCPESIQSGLARTKSYRDKQDYGPETKEALVELHQEIKKLVSEFHRSEWYWLIRVVGKDTSKPLLRSKTLLTT